jgi:hypothetical protein
MAIKRTLKVIGNATKAGFQWPDWSGPLKKVKEELRELEGEIRTRQKDKKRIPRNRRSPFLRLQPGDAFRSRSRKIPACNFG